MCSISLDNESCEILLGVEGDVPEENLLRKLLDGNAALTLSFGCSSNYANANTIDR